LAAPFSSGLSACPRQTFAASTSRRSAGPSLPPSPGTVLAMPSLALDRRCREVASGDPRRRCCQGFRAASPRSSPFPKGGGAMRRALRSALGLGAVLVVGLWAADLTAQPPAPGPKGRPGPPPGAEFRTVRGTVKEFTTAPKGEVDGLILSDGTWVHWPPHL